ncbi:MAG TPA: EamA family transporter [Burkholderiales bacterium]|nr:EamA family transporter [Burkholderiales bacterium]
MTPGFEHALAAMIFLGLVDLVYQRGAAAGVPAHRFLMVQAWCFAPAVTLFGLITGTLAPEAAMLWGMGAGLFVFVALYNFARSLMRGSVSTVAPIFRLSFTVTALLAVLVLGEPLTAYKSAGLALAPAAVWLLLGAEAGAAPAAGTARVALVQAVIAMAAMGVANFFYKMGAVAGASPATFIAGQAATFLPLATIFAWRMDRGLRTTRAAWTHAGTAAALFLLALVLLFESLERGEASVLVPISQMGFVVTAAFGLASLREPFTLRKGAGLAFAVAALACLANS